MFNKKNKNNQENKNNVVKKKYDVAIIGGGQTGLTLAKHLIKKEMNVLVIDKTNLGIKNSLDLKNFSKITKWLLEKNTSPYEIINSMPQRLEHINNEQNKEIISILKSNSFFEFVKGDIEEIDEYSLIVNGESYHFRKLVFATGSYYEKPNYENLSRSMYYNLDEIRKVDKFYNSIAIYGTNIEALELAYVFGKLGTTVYLFDENVNPLNDFDDHIEAILKTEFLPNKINWCLESKILNHIQSSDTTIRIEFASQDETKYVEVEKIFVTGNKKSETRGLNSKYEIPLNAKGSIIIDSSFKVKNNPNYYAIGDVNGIMMNPTQANYQAINLAKILTGETRFKFDPYNKTFTIDIEPEISFHGMNKHELEYRSKKYNEFIYDFNHELNSKLFSHNTKLKVYTNEKHEILGVFIYGQNTKELISLFVIVVANKIKFNKLSSLNLPFYSKVEAFRDAAAEYELEFVGFSKKLQKIKSKTTKGE